MPNNRVVTAYLANEQNYWVDAWNVAGTVTDPAHGSFGALESDGNPLFANRLFKPVGEGNQYVGSAPLGWPGDPSGQVIGSDETSVAITRAYKPSEFTSDKMNFTRLYGTPIASVIRWTPSAGYVFNTFFVTCANPSVGGPFTAYMGPGYNVPSLDPNPDINDAKRVTRILFSPEGFTWGQCYSPNSGGTQPAAVFGNKIVFGEANVRSFPVPTYTVQRPLALGCGGRNLLMDSMPAVSGTHPTIAVSSVLRSDLPELTVPNPPCNGQIFRCKVPESNSPNVGQYIGVFQLTKNLAGELLKANASNKIKVRFWLYPLPYGPLPIPQQPQTIAAFTSFRAALGIYLDPSDLSIPPKDVIAVSREEFGVGANFVGDPEHGWYPVTLDTDSFLHWRRDSNLGANSPQFAFPLGLRLSSGKLATVFPRPDEDANAQQPPVPCDFLIAFDYVLADKVNELGGVKEHSGVALPATSTSTDWPGEKASLTQFTCGSNWTVQLVGEIPDDAWDHTDSDRPADRVLFTLYQPETTQPPQPAQWISVSINAATNAISVKTSNGSTTSIIASTANSIAERFYFLRGTPISIAIRRTASSYDAFVSVGCTRVVGKISLGSQTPAIAPREIRFGNDNGEKLQPMLWYGGRIDESAALSDSAIRTSLETLGMLYLKTTVAPPGIGA